jgi:hypothetical protein
VVEALSIYRYGTIASQSRVHVRQGAVRVEKLGPVGRLALQARLAPQINTLHMSTSLADSHWQAAQVTLHMDVVVPRVSFRTIEGHKLYVSTQ